MSEPQPNTPSWAQQPQGSFGPPLPPTGTDPAAKAKENKKNACLGCGCLGVIAVLVIGGIGALVGGGDSHSTAAAPKSSASAAASTAAPTPKPKPKPAPTPKPAAKPAATTNPTLDTAAAIVAWYTSGGQDHINAMQKDMSNISTDGANQDASQMNTDCGTLSDDVTKAQDYGPIPDEQAQQHWGAALTDFDNAASDCSAGTSTMDASQLAKAAGEITSGSSELGKASSRMTDIGAGM